MENERGGATGLRKVKLFEGTVAEQTAFCGAQKVLADAHFTASVYTPMGNDDAAKVRAQIAGEAPPISFREVVASPVTKRRVAYLQARKTAKAKEKSLGYEDDEPTSAPASVTAAVADTPESRLAAQLAVFAGDPDMQVAVFKKWQKEQSAEAAEKAAEKAQADAAVSKMFDAETPPVAEHKGSKKALAAV